MQESSISPSQGLRIWLLPTDIILQCTMYMHPLKLTLSLEHKIKRKENGLKMSSLKIGPLPFSFSLLTILAWSRIAFSCRFHSNSDPSLSQMKSSAQFHFHWPPYWQRFFSFWKSLYKLNWVLSKSNFSLGHDKYSIFFGGAGFFFILYSTLLHLPPLRFHCADGSWNPTQDRCNLCIGSQTL